MLVTASRNRKTSPLSSMRRNGVSTADPPFYRSRDYRLTTGLPPVSRALPREIARRSIARRANPLSASAGPATQHRGYLHPRSGVQISAITGVVIHAERPGTPARQEAAGRMVSILGRGAPGAGRSTCGGAAGRLAW